MRHWWASSLLALAGCSQMDEVPEGPNDLALQSAARYALAASWSASADPRAEWDNACKGDQESKARNSLLPSWASCTDPRPPLIPDGRYRSVRAADWTPDRDIIVSVAFLDPSGPDEIATFRVARESGQWCLSTGWEEAEENRRHMADFVGHTRLADEAAGRSDLEAAYRHLGDAEGVLRQLPPDHELYDKGIDGLTYYHEKLEAMRVDWLGGAWWLNRTGQLGPHNLDGRVNIHLTSGAGLTTELGTDYASIDIWCLEGSLGSLLSWPRNTSPVPSTAGNELRYRFDDGPEQRTRIENRGWGVIPLNSEDWIGQLRSHDGEKLVVYQDGTPGSPEHHFDLTATVAAADVPLSACAASLGPAD